MIARDETWTENHLFSTFWDDGLIDLLSGVALLIAGVGWTTTLGPLSVLQAPLWIVLWTPLRQRLIEPRAGFVSFSLARRQKNAGRLASTVVLGLGALALALLGALWGGGSSGGDSELVAGLPALIVAVAALVAGGLTGSWRFFAYGFLLGAAAVTTGIMGLHPGVPLALAGGLITVTGLILLLSFLRESREYMESD